MSSELQQAFKESQGVSFTELPVSNAPVNIAPVEAKKDDVLLSPSKTVNESLMEDVHLPTGFHMYDWKNLKVRRFTVENIRALIRARTTGNLIYLVRTVDATINRPISELTVADFWFLMYWHRINSYKKRPFTLTWTCSCPAHLEKVESGELPASSLSCIDTVKSGDIQITELDIEAYNKFVTDIKNEYGVDVTMQRVGDFIQAMDSDNDLEYELEGLREEYRAEHSKDANKRDEELIRKLKDKIDLVIAQSNELTFMYRYASCLLFPNKTLAQKTEWLSKSESPDILVDLDEFMEKCEHGVKEEWVGKCKECGTSKTIKQSFDVLDFLP